MTKIIRMTEKDWDEVDGFSTNEKWGDPFKMCRVLIYTMADFRKYVGKPVIIHNAFEARSSGWHPEGVALDCHVEGMHVMDMYFAAERFDAFNGIGVYPSLAGWNRPGLHLDTRPRGKLAYDSRWGCIGPKQYVQLNWDFIKLL